MNKGIKWIGYIVFIILFALVTFFGLGPVLMADGTLQERLLTLVIVIIIYIILIYALRYWLKRINKK
ncbi:MAG TPA: hypothetical protein GXX53_00225 [Tissierellia bacterium]|nr:hypothetical protein [Tissierellia bacterium]